MAPLQSSCRDSCAGHRTGGTWGTPKALGSVLLHEHLFPLLLLLFLPLCPMVLLRFLHRGLLVLAGKQVRCHAYVLFLATCPIQRKIHFYAEIKCWLFFQKTTVTGTCLFHNGSCGAASRFLPLPLWLVSIRSRLLKLSITAIWFSSRQDFNLTPHGLASENTRNFDLTL